MKHLTSLTLLALTGCAAAPAATQVPRDPHRAVAVYLGERSFDDDGYGTLDDQGMLGGAYEWGEKGGNAVWETGFLGSREDKDMGVEGTAAEAFVGGRYQFPVGVSPVRPYIGGGVALITTKLEGPGLDDDDSSAGVYFHAGADLSIDEHFFIGVDFRVLTGTDVELTGFTVDDADYEMFTIRLGYSF